MKNLKLLIMIFCLSSCAFIKDVRFNQYYRVNKLDQKIPASDYVDHLYNLGQSFLGSSKDIQVEISKQDTKYLEKLYSSIVNQNRKFFIRNYQPRFIFLKDTRPFYFSLPKGLIFLSTGLIKKYIESEDLLASILLQEAIKTNRHIYKKELQFPLGHISVEKLIQFSRLDISTKVELNKWAYSLMKDTRLDEFSYLNWIQIINKNALDFHLQVTDSRVISREEFEFKNFIVKQKKDSNEKEFQRNSSSSFYRFIKRISRES